MTAGFLEDILDVLDVLWPAGIIAGVFIVFRGRKITTAAAFFLFAMVSLLLTNAYWLAHSLLRPDARIPVAANTIGECALYLLTASAMNAAIPDRRFSFSPQVFCTVLFALASIALWIAWTGEWTQDVMGGIAFGYLLVCCVWRLRQVNALSGKEWIALGILTAAYMALFALDLNDEKPPISFTAHLLMFLTMIFFLYRAFRSVRRGEAAGRQIVLSVSACAICFSGAYLSWGYWYSAAVILRMLSMPLMLVAFGREAEDA